MKNIAIAFFSLLIISKTVHAQSVLTDSAQYISALNNAKGLYQSTIKENYSLYNGGEYGIKGHQVNGSPFFYSADMQKGSIFYKDGWYNDIDMKYDITSEQIVIYDYSKTNLIALQNERIPFFRINGHDFFHMDSSAALHVKGFYERLCAGTNTLWAKRFKKMELSPRAEDQTAQFKEYDTYYLQKANDFYQISSKSQLEHLMQDKISQIKKYIRQNNISFKHHFEEAAIKTVDYYNQLIH